MHIFYAAGSKPNGALIESKVWYHNLYLPLCDLGHTVSVLDYDLEPHYTNADPSRESARQFNQVSRPRLEEQLIAQIVRVHRRKPIDLFFSYFYSTFVRPEVIQEIKRMGICTVNWYCNASYQFHLVEEIAPTYDFCLVPEKFRLDDYRRVGAHPIYCQEAANPQIYKPVSLPREYAVTFVGACYGERGEYIRYLLDRQIDVRVWGPGWSALHPPKEFARKIRWQASRIKSKILGRSATLYPVLPARISGAPLSDDEMVRLYSRSKISLGFSKVGETHRSSQPVKQIRLRDFEAPMSGAFYMIEYMEELEDFFDIGKEIVCYLDKHDLADKIKYYLNHDAERERIRLAGHRRAVSEHTWQKRFQRAFAEMGL
jgi:hypothetical protein